MNRELLGKFIKFLIVGGVCTLINYGIFYGLFHYIKIQYLLSSIIGYISGLLLGYFINKFWTYQVDKKAKDIFVIKYMVIYMISLFVSTAFLKLLVETLLLNPLLANIFAIGLSTIMNFVGTNFLVFRNNDGAGTIGEKS
ncbi:MAG: GtrA family protein [Leptospiraceae bacterium]|nr:GtrA family protein [Leptospiraceae bacterium]